MSDKALEIVFAIAIVAVGLGFAFWFAKDQEAKREAREDEEQRDALEQGLVNRGLPPGERPLPRPAIEILNGGDFADNAKHVDSCFRSEFWKVYEEPLTRGDMGGALRHAMEVCQWREGSRGQVLDQLFDRRMISEAERDRMKRDYESRLPGGYGVFA